MNLSNNAHTRKCASKKCTLDLKPLADVIRNPEVQKSYLTDKEPVVLHCCAENGNFQFPRRLFCLRATWHMFMYSYTKSVVTVGWENNAGIVYQWSLLVTQLKHWPDSNQGTDYIAIFLFCIYETRFGCWPQKLRENCPWNSFPNFFYTPGVTCSNSHPWNTDPGPFLPRTNEPYHCAQWAVTLITSPRSSTSDHNLPFYNFPLNEKDFKNQMWQKDFWKFK